MEFEISSSKNDLAKYSENYDKTNVPESDDSLSEKFQKINKMSSKLTKIIQNVAQIDKGNVKVVESEEKSKTEPKEKLTKQNDALKRITKSLQELSLSKPKNNSNGPVLYANNNNNATIEYAKKSVKKVFESVEELNIEEPKTVVETEKKINDDVVIDNQSVIVIEDSKSLSKKDLPIKIRNQYEIKLDKLTSELAIAEKELKKISKEYLPLLRIKKAYERDTSKLAKKEMQVAKQKVSLYGIKNTKISEEKSERIKNEMAIIEDLRDSIKSCEVVLKQNENRLPDLEKSYTLINRHIQLIQEDINHLKELIDNE